MGGRKMPRDEENAYGKNMSHNECLSPGVSSR